MNENLIRLEKFKLELKSRPCPCCNKLSLDVIKLKPVVGSNKLMYILFKPKQEEIKQFNGVIIKQSSSAVYQEEFTEGEPIEPFYGVYCFDCEWEADIIGYGNVDPECIEYAPNALYPNQWKIPKNKCQASRTNSAAPCNAKIKKGFFCSKHDTQENKNILKLWASARNIKIDLT